MDVGKSFTTDDLIALASSATIFDLGARIGADTEVLPFHVPFHLSLQHRHGDVERPGDASFANELVTMSLHTGTHIDAIGHFSCEGQIFDGAPAEDIEGASGLRRLDAAELDIVLSRGVLLDVPAHRGVDALPPGEGIGADELHRVALAQGVRVGRDAVLVRTGWSPDRCAPSMTEGFPGIDLSAAEWLLDRGAHLVGADTPAVEQTPPGGLVHSFLIARHGVPLVENLDLASLARARVYEFFLIALPLPIEGGTASPLRPVALSLASSASGT